MNRRFAIKSLTEYIVLLFLAFIVFGCVKKETSPEASTPIFITPSHGELSVPLPLSNAILTVDEIIEQYPGLEGYFGGAIDVTDELLEDNYCFLECAKHIWTAGRYGPRQFTITLARTVSSENANILVENTHETFIDIDDLSDRITLAHLPKNAWGVYNYPRQEFVLNFSYGRVYVLAVSQPNDGFDDFAGEFDLISLVSRLQMEKLNASGYIP